MLKVGAIQLVIYPPTGAYSFQDDKVVRRTAVAWGVPCITTMSGARAAVEALASRRRACLCVWSPQEIHACGG